MSTSEELKETLRLITKVSTDSRVLPGQGDQLQSAKRELETIARSGKPEKRRIFRVAKNLATVLLEIVEQDVSQRPE